MKALRGFLYLLFLLLPLWSYAAAPSHPSHAAIASAQPLATKAGMEILKKGGNAFDAAVAVSAALGVVEPYSSGLGGGGFYLLHEADTNHDIMVDGRERAPHAATRGMYLNRQGGLNVTEVRRGALSAGIPGTPAALVHIAKKYGKLGLASDLAPAIRLADEGFRVDPRMAAITASKVSYLKKFCGPHCPYLINGRAPRTGEVIRQPQLARTMELLVRKGDNGFYRGRVAASMVARVRVAGGIWTLKDLADYRAVERKPLTGDYRGYHIVTASPPGSGLVVLETLNILSGYNLNKVDPATRIHLIVEAWRHAYRDRNEYMGDPDYVKIPIHRLLDPMYAAGIRASIRMDRALPSDLLPPVTVAPEGMHTTHFSILDKQGNRVAATQTINFRYGSGIMAKDTGVILNNEMDDFAAKPGTPNGFGLVQGEVNAVAPGKRPLSSMSPTFIESPRGVAIIGTPGGSRIISMVTLALLDYVNGASAAQITALPRFHHQYLPDVISYEPGAFTSGEITKLRAMGYTLRQTSRRYGNMNVVVWDYHGNKVEAATDPRNEAFMDF